MSRMDNPSTPQRTEGGATSQIRETASEVGQNLREMGAQARGAAQEQMEQIRHSAQEYYEQGRQKAAEYYEQGRQRAVEFQQGVEDYVREQPVKSILIAAGVGMLLGILWRRS